jgi:predicted DNA-binding transcriptional regulator AlpA
MNETITLQETGFLRLPAVLKIIPVSRSSWWQGVKDGRYPQPVKLGARAVGWRIEDIRSLVADLAGTSRAKTNLENKKHLSQRQYT